MFAVAGNDVQVAVGLANKHYPVGMTRKGATSHMPDLTWNVRGHKIGGGEKCFGFGGRETMPSDVCGVPQLLGEAHR